MNNNQKNIIAWVVPIASLLVFMKFASIVSEIRRPFLFDRTWWVWLIWVSACGYFEFKVFGKDGDKYLSHLMRKRDIRLSHFNKIDLSYFWKTPLLVSGLVISSAVPHLIINENDFYPITFGYTLVCFIIAYFYGKKREIGLYWTFVIGLFISPLLSLLVAYSSPKLPLMTPESKRKHHIRLLFSFVIMTLGTVMVISYGNVYSNIIGSHEHSNFDKSYIINTSIIPNFLRGIGLIITGYYFFQAKRYLEINSVLHPK